MYNGAMEEYLTFIEVEWWGTCHGPRVELPGWPVVHSCLASKKVWGMSYMDLYWREPWQMMYASARASCQKFLMMCFTSPLSNISLCEWTIAAPQPWTVLHRDFSCVTTANGLDYAYASTERSAMIDRGVLPLHMYTGLQMKLCRLGFRYLLCKEVL